MLRHLAAIHFMALHHLLAVGYQHTGCFQCMLWLLGQRNARGYYQGKGGKERAEREKGTEQEIKHNIVLTYWMEKAQLHEGCKIDAELAVFGGVSLRKSAKVHYVILHV